MIIEAERTFDCCGLGINATDSSDIDTKPSLEDHEWSITHMVFTEGVHKCFGAYTDISRECYTCYAKLYSMVTFYTIMFMSALNLPFNVSGPGWVQYCWWCRSFLLDSRGRKSDTLNLHQIWDLDNLTIVYLTSMSISAFGSPDGM